MAEAAGRRALVVEDEGGVALLIEDMLKELGYTIAGSIATLAEALRAANADTFDFALLDVNLDGQMIFPVAQILRSRRLPFVFSTGYGQNGIPESFKGCQILNKPFAIEELEQKLALALGMT